MYWNAEILTNASSDLNTSVIVFIVGVGVVSMPLLYFVHRALNYCCLAFARRL
jgi:hypothetical protein